jgi:hypothetical protein
MPAPFNFDHLRFTLLPVAEFDAALGAALAVTVTDARKVRERLEAQDKVRVFTDLDGGLRVAVRGNYAEIPLSVQPFNLFPTLKGKKKIQTETEKSQTTVPSQKQVARSHALPAALFGVLRPLANRPITEQEIDSHLVGIGYDQADCPTIRERLAARGFLHIAADGQHTLADSQEHPQEAVS